MQRMTENNIFYLLFLKKTGIAFNISEYLLLVFLTLKHEHVLVEYVTVN